MGANEEGERLEPWDPSRLWRGLLIAVPLGLVLWFMIVSGGLIIYDLYTISQMPKHEPTYETEPLTKGQMRERAEKFVKERRQ